VAAFEVADKRETALGLGLCRQLGRSGQSFGDAPKPDSEDAVTYADQAGHTAHRNKLSRHWTKKVELDRKPQDSGSEKASCSEQQCYRLFDTQRLEECIDWIHCGSPEGDRTVRERRPPIVSSTGIRCLPFLPTPLPRRHRIRIRPQSPSMLAGVGFRRRNLSRESCRTRCDLLRGSRAVQTPEKSAVLAPFGQSVTGSRPPIIRRWLAESHTPSETKIGMSWQHQFITVDQNQLRNADAIASSLRDCSQNGLRLLLPDGAFLEFSKGSSPIDTARLSLRLLAPYRENVCSSRKIAEMMADERKRGTPCATLVQQEATACLRSILEELERSDELALRRLFDGPGAELMRSSLEIWNNHDANKQLVIELCAAFKAGMSSDQLNALRRSPGTAISEWLSSPEGVRFVFQGIKSRGADEEAAYELTRTPSVSAGFISAIAGLALHWLAFGGLESAGSQILSGDLNDIEYVVLGTLSHSLATGDKRAMLLCEAVANAFEVRRSLPCWTEYTES
jgi:hypothetical protein